MAAIGMVIISKIVSLLIFRISPYVVADIGRFTSPSPVSTTEPIEALEQS